MENELNRLIEQQNKEYELETHTLDDDNQSNCDIDDFEQRLKFNKTGNRFFSKDDSDSDDDRRPSTNAKKNVTFQPPKHTKPSLLNDEPDLLRQVQQMHQNKSKEMMSSSKKPEQKVDVGKSKQEEQQRAEYDKMLEILNSNNTGLKDKKLKELIQKNKELYVNMEKEKALRQKLQKDIEKIKAETDMQLNSMGVKAPKGDNTFYKQQDKQQDDSVDWKKKYNELEKRLQESKLQNTTLKNDLNKAMRVISKEIGDNVNIDSVLAEENSWKGRQQQIEVLRARVKELQSKVDISYMDKTQSEMGMMGTGKSFNAAGGKAKERREEMENLRIQYEALRAENDSLNEKVKALNSRKTILEKENKELKNESERAKQILKEKSDNDDRYIMALKKEVEKLKDKSPGVQTRIVYRDKPVEAKKTDNDEGDDSLAKKEIYVLKNELDKKEKIIKELISDKLRNTTNTFNKENVVQESLPDQEKMVKLETMIKLLKQENEELSNLKLGIKSPTPDSKLIKDLSLQNAQLRRKVDDLQQKLKAYQ